MLGKMKEEGYGFEIYFVFYDVEEEDKECYFIIYSEKLVIVFVFINIVFLIFNINVIF